MRKVYVYNGVGEHTNKTENTRQESEKRSF